MTIPRISVKSQNDGVIFTDKTYPLPPEDSLHLPATSSFRASEDVRLFFASDATLALFEDISWGKSYRFGDVEQGGILVGSYHSHKSAGRELIWGEVKAVIPARPELVQASFSSLNFSFESWRDMKDRASRFASEGWLTLGWYHTHLHNVSPRFTHVDYATQRQTFTYKYSFAVVLNPNQQKWSLYFGPDAAEGSGDMVLDKTHSERYSRPQRPRWFYGDFTRQQGSPHRQQDALPATALPATIEALDVATSLTDYPKRALAYIGDALKRSFLAEDVPQPLTPTIEYRYYNLSGLDSARSPARGLFIGAKLSPHFIFSLEIVLSQLMELSPGKEFAIAYCDIPESTSPMPPPELNLTPKVISVQTGAISDLFTRDLPGNTVVFYCETEFQEVITRHSLTRERLASEVGESIHNIILLCNRTQQKKLEVHNLLR